MDMTFRFLRYNSRGQEARAWAWFLACWRWRGKSTNQVEDESSDALARHMKDAATLSLSGHGVCARGTTAFGVVEVNMRKATNRMPQRG